MNQSPELFRKKARTRLSRSNLKFSMIIEDAEIDQSNYVSPESRKVSPDRRRKTDMSFEKYGVPSQSSIIAAKINKHER